MAATTDKGGHTQSVTEKKEEDKQWFKGLYFTLNKHVAECVCAWCIGHELLNRKWAKKDEIEYDSDPAHKQKDNKSHIHKGVILKVTDNGGHGKLMVYSV